MKILLSNDDGINSIGLRSLYKELKNLGHEFMTVAPLHEQSGVSSMMHFWTPITYQHIEEPNFKGIAVDGTPGDCVMIALKHFYNSPQNRPDLVISGINKGHNLGLDVVYSGTVAAAREGANAGIHSIAVSRWMHEEDNPNEVARLAAQIINDLPWNDMSKICIWNLNFPPFPVRDMRELRICPLAGTQWQIHSEESVNNSGERNLSLANIPFPYNETQNAEGSDADLLCKRYITLTPVLTNLTDWEILHNNGVKIMQKFNSNI